MASVLQQQGTLRMVDSFEPDYASCTIREFTAESGMQLAVIEQKGSNMKVYAAFANQTPGCAVSHAVQRIVSKSLSSAYPNTDTSTDTGHPIYTLESAGREDFAKVLPDYLKHILSPITNDAVKAEFQNTDDKPHSLEVMHRTACRLLHSENAQRALTPDQILRYHRDMYQLRNLRLVIVGEHDHLPQIQNELDRQQYDDYSCHLPPWWQNACVFQSTEAVYPTHVRTERLEIVEERVTELLQDIAKKPVDMDRMRECIKQEKSQDQLEAQISELYFPRNIISEYASGNRDDSTLRKFQSLSEYGTLEKWTGENWGDFSCAR
ncbi:Metalloenzyme, LuxS/M16 peptidase-like, metal-binding protein [Metarhizium guizhouense ARSEF 977]|uniref:Metalloenzyme, LuxS/M16 peptidase-like, metal-binding protein n=1 Tax=Metarhizium guizhouense (strain ARSEF 977) TaxID=1276136 RepID=A0A0B4GQ04_METGA|nr:Metalloenzyme, LuxS/M16 peptidase-like, metal-binding protein [Metarhizium guizhouense ARSEF 977]